MSSKPTVPEQNPAEIAREAFKRLALRRIAPTPEAYREIYNEIAGIADTAAAPVATIGSIDPGPESVLSQFATRLTEGTGDLADFGRRFNRAVKSRDWDGYARMLSQLVEKHFISKKPGIEVAGMDVEDEQSRALRELLSRTLTYVDTRAPSI